MLARPHLLEVLSSTALTGVVDVESAPWSSPTPVADTTRGRPEARTVHLLDTGDLRAGLWTCTPGGFRSDRRGYVEFLHVVSGEATLTGDDGTSWRLAAGTTLVVPDGWLGTWEVASTITTSFAVFGASGG